MKIALFLVAVVSLQGCIVTQSTTELAEGGTVLYKKNRLLLTVVDERGNALENASVYIASKSGKIAYALIEEINRKPLKTNSNGNATLSTGGTWAMGFASETECIYYNSQKYCRRISSTEVEYNETLRVELPGFNDFSVNYQKLIYCRIENAICYSSKTDAGTLDYTVKYRVQMSSSK